MKSKKFKVSLTLTYITYDRATQGEEHAFFQTVLRNAQTVERLVLKGDLAVEEVKEEK